MGIYVQHVHRCNVISTNQSQREKLLDIINENHSGLTWIGYIWNNPWRSWRSLLPRTKDIVDIVEVINQACKPC